MALPSSALREEPARQPFRLPGGRNPRIVLVIPSLQVGGLQKVVVRLVRHFHGQLDHLVLTPSTDGPLRLQFPEGVTVLSMAEQRLSGKYNVLGMARVFRRYRPDIVHTRNWTCIDAIVAARLTRVPLVIHGEHGREAADPHGRNPFRRRVRRWLSPLVTEFVTVSRDLEDWLVEGVGVPASRITQIYNGVDVEAFAPSGRAEARRALGIRDDDFAVGTVGRLDPVKGHDSLLQAFGLLPRDRRCQLLIVGGGPGRPDLQRLQGQLGLGDRLRLLGERQDIGLILRSLDVFVLPSLGEGISNAILEAMATGLPVVATRVGGNPELVEDGVTGVLVDPGSHRALATALAGYLDDPALARRHGEAGRLRVLKDFSLDRMFAAYGDLYARLLKGRRGP